MHLWRARSARAQAWKYNMYKMHFLAFRSTIANIIPPAQMTTTARTAPKFCANIRAERPEMFVLDLNYYGISGNIEPWPECQPEASQPASASGWKNVKKHSVFCVFLSRISPFTKQY